MELALTWDGASTAKTNWNEYSTILEQLTWDGASTAENWVPQIERELDM